MKYFPLRPNLVKTELFSKLNEPNKTKMVITLVLFGDC